MKSLRNSLRRALLAVPVATCACVGSPAGSASTGSGTSGSSAAGSGSTATGSTGGTASGTDGAGCISQGLCSADCLCSSSLLQVAPLLAQIPPTGELGFCSCVVGCPQLPDGGTGPSSLNGCSASQADAGAPDGGPLWDLTCYYAFSCSGGRRPAGLIEEAPQAETGLGAYFAQLAHLEAASVVAFRRMARELVLHAAPERLVQRAQRAARDEVRHARMTRLLAEQFGGIPNRVEIPPVVPRSLEAFATENACEGCVGETFGAALASWQADHASDPEVRDVARALRDDELLHAELAWEIDAWAQPRLPAAAQERVRTARRAAIQRLASAPARLRPEESRRAGIPTTLEHTRLVAALEREVWG